MLSHKRKPLSFSSTSLYSTLLTLHSRQRLLCSWFYRWCHLNHYFLVSPNPYRILFLLSLPRFVSLWAVAPLTLLNFFHSPQYMLISLSAPSCYWQSSLLQYPLNFFQSPSFPPPPLPVPENSLILFWKMYSLPIAFARSPSPPPRKQKSSFCSSSEDHESRWLMVSPSSLTQSLLL